MNTRSIRIVLAAAALAVAVAGASVARDQAVPKGKGVSLKAVPFSATTVFSGTLTGEIVVDGQSVFINDQTTFHKVGVGPVESGQSVRNTPILIGGVMKGKKAIATMILIGEPETGADFSQDTVAEDSGPRGAR